MVVTQEGTSTHIPYARLGLAYLGTALVATLATRGIYSVSPALKEWGVGAAEIAAVIDVSVGRYMAAALTSELAGFVALAIASVMLVRCGPRWLVFVPAVVVIALRVLFFALLGPMAGQAPVYPPNAYWLVELVFFAAAIGPALVLVRPEPRADARRRRLSLLGLAAGIVMALASIYLLNRGWRLAGRPQFAFFMPITSTSQWFVFGAIVGTRRPFWPLWLALPSGVLAASNVARGLMLWGWYPGGVLRDLLPVVLTYGGASVWLIGDRIARARTSSVSGGGRVTEPS